MVLAERNRHIAALRDRDTVGKRRRQIGEFLDHRRLRREVLLPSEVSRPPRIGKDVTFGDAHARFVRAKIGGPQKLDRMRGHNRHAKRGSE